MYRQRSNRPTLLLPLLLGVLFAAVFFYLNNSPVDVTAAAQPASQPDDPAASTQPTLALPTAAAVARPTARLALPNAGVDAPIIDVFIREGTWDVGSLSGNVGHLYGTSPLGEVGNHGLAGHSELRDGSRGIFAYIQQLNYGDPIDVTMNGVTYQYRVSGMQHVEPDDLSVLQPTTTDRLTLITCDDYDFLRDVYVTRVVVFADRVI